MPVERGYPCPVVLAKDSPYHGVEFWILGRHVTHEEGLSLLQKVRGLSMTHVKQELRLIGHE